MTRQENGARRLTRKIENNMYSVLTEEKTVYLAYLKQMQADVSQWIRRPSRKIA